MLKKIRDSFLRNEHCPIPRNDGKFVENKCKRVDATIATDLIRALVYIVMCKHVKNSIYGDVRQVK